MALRNPILCLILYYIGFKLIIIVSLILLLYLLYEMLHKNAEDYTYRIKFFFLNWFLVILYVGVYFGLVLYLRIIFSNTNTDLKLYIKKLKQFYIETNLFDFTTNGIIMILFFLLLIYSLANVHKFFIMQLIKRFLIIHVVVIQKFHIDLNNYLLLFRLKAFMELVCLNVIFNLWLKSIYSELKNILWQIAWRTVRFIILTLPTVILYLYFFYMITFNNLVISASFYKYLLFYFVFFTYRRIHFFLDETDFTLNQILYRMYYLERSYWYINIPEDYQKVILRYLNLGLSRNMRKTPELLLDEVLGHYGLFMATECCFYSKNGYEYTNGRYSFFEEKNERQDIIFDYSFLKKLPAGFNKKYHNIFLFLILALSIFEVILLILLLRIKIHYLSTMILSLSNMLLILLPMVLLIYFLCILKKHYDK